MRQVGVLVLVFTACGAPEMLVSPPPPLEVVPQPCLVASREVLDFGTTELGCRAHDQQVTVTNTCSTPVALTRRALLSSEAQLISAPPDELAAGSTTTLAFSFAPVHVGTVSSVAPLLGLPLTLRGTGAQATRFEESWQLPSLVEPELLIVLDDGAEMLELRDAVSQNLSIVRRIAGGRVGVLTTAADSTLQQSDAITGTQTAPSSCLDSLTHFATGELAGFHHPGARLSVLCITRRPDASTAPVLERVSHLQTLLPGGTFFHLIGHDDPGALTFAANAFHGAVGDLYDPNWSRSVPSFTSFFGSNLLFHLEHLPDVSRDALQVEVNDEVIPHEVWQWDSEKNAILFSLIAIPAPGSRVSVSGLEACR